MSDLATIIADLEKATEPSRELDVAISCAAWPDKFRRATGPSSVLLLDERGNVAGIDHPSHFTSSIDAALTLVPDRALWVCGSMEDGSFARVIPAQKGGSFIGAEDFHSIAATPVIALCVAALKARFS